MSEIVLKEIEMRMYKDLLTYNQMNKHVFDDKDLNKDTFKIKELKANSFYAGEIFVDNQYYGALGLEKEYWSDKSTPDQEFLDRIIIKLYDRKGKNIGIIEERILKELMQSAVSGKLPVFTISLSGIPYMIDVEKESGKLIFPLITNKSKKIFEIFELSKKALRADFVVTRTLGEEKVADIDSRRGGKIEIKVYDSEISKLKQFTDILALFAATIKFHDAIGEKIEKALEALETGVLVLKPPKKALELMVNPRKAKRISRLKDTDEDDEDKEEKAAKRKRRKTQKKRKLRGVDQEEEEEEEAKPKVKKRTSKKLKKVKKEAAKLEKFKKLLLADPVDKASGVSKTIAANLEALGIYTVEDLLAVDAEELATVLENPAITKTKVRRWQTSSRKRVKVTLEEADSHPDDKDDYDLLDYGF